MFAGMTTPRRHVGEETDYTIGKMQTGTRDPVLFRHLQAPIPRVGWPRFKVTRFVLLRTPTDVSGSWLLARRVAVSPRVSTLVLVFCAPSTMQALRLSFSSSWVRGGPPQRTWKPLQRKAFAVVIITSAVVVTITTINIIVIAIAYPVIVSHRMLELAMPIVAVVVFCSFFY